MNVKLISEVSKYFKPQELVDQNVYSKFGDNSWKFLDETILETLLALRVDILKVPLVINDYLWKGNNSQRGLRTNLSQICYDKTKSGILYLSPHPFGKAIDATSSKMTAEEMRDIIVKDAYKLPYPVRIEDGVSWLHIDTMVDVNYKFKVTKFR